MILLQFISIVIFIVNLHASTPQSCFYTHPVTFFSGQSSSSPQRLNGYNFEFNWRTPQLSIINSSFIYVVARSQYLNSFRYRAHLSKITHLMGSINLNPVNGSDILSITLNIILFKQVQKKVSVSYQIYVNFLEQLNSKQTEEDELSCAKEISLQCWSLEC